MSGNGSVSAASDFFDGEIGCAGRVVALGAALGEGGREINATRKRLLTGGLDRGSNQYQRMEIPVSPIPAAEKGS